MGLTNAVVYAAAAVFDAHSDTARRGPRGGLRTLQLQYTGALPGDPERIATTTRQLASANRGLTDYARRKYGLNPVDLAGLDDLVMVSQQGQPASSNAR